MRFASLVYSTIIANLPLFPRFFSIISLHLQKLKNISYGKNQ